MELILIGAAGLVAAFLFGKKTEQTNSGTTTVNDAKKEVVKKELSYSESWYSQSADTLEMRLQRTWRSASVLLPSHADGVKAVDDCLKIIISLKTKSDYLKLVEKFGKRSDVAPALTIISPKEPLNKWLINYLEDKDYTNGKTKINALTFIKTHLKKLNVTL